VPCLQALEHGAEHILHQGLRVAVRGSRRLCGARHSHHATGQQAQGVQGCDTGVSIDVRPTAACDGLKGTHKRNASTTSKHMYWQGHQIVSTHSK
jgi:hypothetical protein